jgi:hypothetical protein
VLSVSLSAPILDLQAAGALALDDELPVEARRRGRG